MKLLALNCEHCGAPLEVPLLVRHVTCEYCASQLEVHRSSTTSFTEVVEAMEARAEPLTRDVEHLKRHKELLDLDRQWMRERKRYGFGSDNEMQVPSETGTIFSGGVLAALGLSIAVLGVLGEALEVMLPGLFLMGTAVALIAYWLPKATNYKRKQRLYRQRRDAICRAIRNGSESLSDADRWLPPS